MRVLFFTILFVLSCRADECSGLLLRFKNKFISLDRLATRVDFPIEKVFPDLQIKNGYIPKGSRAYILWRQKSSPWIPDESFLFHYMDRSQTARELGFLVPDLVDHIAADGVKISEWISASAQRYLKDYYHKQKELFLFPINNTPYKPRQVVKERFGSISAMYDELSISFSGSDSKWKRLLDSRAEEVSWLVSGDGTVYFWTPRESKLVYKATNDLMPGSHVDVLALVTDHPEHLSSFPDVGSLIAYGMVDFKSGVPKVSDYMMFEKGKNGDFDFLHYLELYFQRD